VVFNDNHFGTSMPGAGAVHPIKTSAKFACSMKINGLRFA